MSTERERTPLGFGLLVIGSLVTGTANARGVSPEDLIGLIDVGVPAVSPDGRWVAVEVREADLARNVTIIRWKTIDLQAPGRVIDAGEGGRPIIEIFRGQITGFSVPQQPKWSPDSEWIAYRAKSTADSATGDIQVWRSHRDAAIQQQLTHAASDVERFCWSPDGKELIFSVSAARSRFEAEMRSEANRGFLYDDRFSPYHSRAPLFDPKAEESKSVWARDLESGVERIASDDEAKACGQGGDPMPSSAQRLQPTRSVGINPPMTVVGCPAPECTGHFKGVWSSNDGRTLYFLRWVNSHSYGPMAIYAWRLGSRRVATILRTEDLIDSCEKVAHELVCARESATRPRTLVAIDIRSGRSRTIFDPNPNFANLEFGAVTPLTWRDPSGIEGFGHLVMPLSYQPGRRYPLVIVQYRSRGFLRGGIGDEYPIHAFSARGFAVLSFERPDDPDLEASVQSYEELEEKGWINLRDRRRVLSVLNAGIDQLERMVVIDVTKVGITGLSDGGETVGFALVTEPTRFAAAAASWIAYSPSVYFMMGPKFQGLLSTWGLGFPRGPAADQWQRVSLALNARTVETPLLIQVSDQELLPEAETVASLREYGKPVEMYVFPGEAHVKTRPQHRYHIYRRNLQWFQFWLQGVEASDPVDERQYERWRALRGTNRAVRH